MITAALKLKVFLIFVLVRRIVLASYNLTTCHGSDALCYVDQSLISSGDWREIDALGNFFKGCNGYSWTNARNWCFGETIDPYDPYTDDDFLNAQCIENLITDPCTGNIVQYPVGYVTEDHSIWDELFCDSGLVTGISFTRYRNVSCDLNAVGGNLSHLVNLNSFVIIENDIFGDVPAFFGETGVSSIDLSSNSLDGSIPDIFSGLANSLYAFSVYDNSLTGTIPSSVSLCTNMLSLDINDNYLTGSFPSFKNLTSLVTVRAQNNRLSGPILSLNSTSLIQLRLQNNHFTGQVPDITISMDIRYFLLQNNAFTGGILPLDLLRYTSLQYFRIDGNNVSSFVPEVSSSITMFRLYGPGNFWYCPFPSPANSIVTDAISLINCTCMPGSSCNSSTHCRFSCATCPGGQFSNGTNQPWCTDCKAGKYSNVIGRKQDCEECKPGSYSPTDASTLCTDCVAIDGFAQNRSGQTGCHYCPDGTYSGDGSNCTLCPVGRAGTGPTSSRVVSSIAGKVNTVFQCAACSQGTFADHKGMGGNDCSCTEGCATPFADSTCDSDGCTYCDVGYTAVGGPDSVWSAGRSSCTICTAGKYWDGNFVPCQNCSKGRYQADEAEETCDYCNAGYYQPYEGQTACLACQPGYAQPTTANYTCPACEPGTYTNDTAATSCTDCAAGQYQPNEASIECLTCPVGHYSASKSTSLSDCKAPSLQPTTLSPTPVPSLHPTPTPSLQPTLASSLSYSPTVNPTLLCVPGQYISSIGLCTDCIPGRYSSFASAPFPSTCTKCPGGQYNEFLAQSSCLNCEPGTYTNDTAAATSCTDCAAGQYQPNETSIECLTCPVGHYSAVKSTSLSDCKAPSLHPTPTPSLQPTITLSPTPVPSLHPTPTPSLQPTITLSPTPAPTQISLDCDFDDGDCHFGNIDNGDNWGWKRISGTTPTGLTGPDVDHTTGSGSYIYTEVLSCTSGTFITTLDIAAVTGGDFDDWGVSFYYLMYGANMGDLFLETSTDDGSTLSIQWTKSGQQQTDGTTWGFAEVSFPTGTKFIQWRGVGGGGSRSDMAIDDFTIIPAPTPTPTFEPTSGPTSLPTFQPIPLPTAQPTPLSLHPTTTPSLQPTLLPSLQPTTSPSPLPTLVQTPPPASPTTVPSSLPTLSDQVFISVSLSIAVVNETDITETVIVNTLASVLGGLGVASSNIVMFDYADWTPSRRLTDRTHAEMNLFAQRLLSGVASVTANIIISLSDTFYTSAGDLKSAVSDEMDSAESDGTLVSALGTECGCTVLSASSTVTLSRNNYPTHGPTSSPSSQPLTKSRTPWFDTYYYYIFQLVALTIGVVCSMGLAYFFKKRVGRWPPILQTGVCALSINALGSEVIFCIASTSEQFCEDCPTATGVFILLITFFVCGPAMIYIIYQKKLALDSESTLNLASVYAPLLLLIIFDGEMLIWMPWIDTEATRALTGFPDISSMSFTTWSILCRKVPFIFLIMKLRPRNSSLVVLTSVFSGLSLLIALAQKLLRAIGFSLKDVDVAVVSTTDLKHTSSHGDVDSVAGQGVGKTRSTFIGSTSSTTQEGESAFSLKNLGLLILCVVIAVIVFTDSVPSNDIIVDLIILVICILGGLLVLVIASLITMKGSMYCLQCSDQTLIRNSYINQLQEQNFEERAQRESVTKDMEYTRQMLISRGIDIESLLPLDEVKERYRDAMKNYEADQSDKNLALVEKLDEILRVHPDLKAEKDAMMAAWRLKELGKCQEAHSIMRSFIPAKLNGAKPTKLQELGLSVALSRRVAHQAPLWLIVKHVSDIERMHPSDLVSKDVNSLDILELRAVFASLPESFGVDAGGVKKEWRDRVQTRLQKLCEKEENGTLTPQEQRHASYKGVERGPFDPAIVIEPSHIITSTAFAKTESGIELTDLYPGSKIVAERLHAGLFPSEKLRETSQIDSDVVVQKRNISKDHKNKLENIFQNINAKEQKIIVTDMPLETTTTTERDVQDKEQDCALHLSSSSKLTGML